MAERPTTSELFKQKLVTPESLRSATDAAIGEAPPTDFPIAEGYVLDLPAAISGHAEATKAMADPHAREAYRRNMVMTAILLARPVKA